MKHGLQRVVSGFLMLAMLIGLTPFAMAATKTAGAAIDVLIPNIDDCLPELEKALYGVEDIAISKESFAGKSGTIYFNVDKTKIMMMGEESYRTYSFTDEDRFNMAVASVCYLLDTTDILDFGIKVYYVKDSEPETLSKDTISEISAMLTNFLN